MRKRTISTLVAMVLALLLTTSIAAAAPSASQDITINFTWLQYSSLLGGSMTGSAVVTGTVTDGQLSRLRGTANLPLRDSSLTIDPVAALPYATRQLNVQWSRWECGPFTCTFTSGVSIFEQQFGEGPVEIRFGQLRGDGRLLLATTPTCVADCPPPGSFYWIPGPFAVSTLNGGVVSSQDGGTLWMNGPAPIVQ